MGAELCQPCVEFLNESNKLETNELVSCCDVYYIYMYMYSQINMKWGISLIKIKKLYWGIKV